MAYTWFTVTANDSRVSKRQRMRNHSIVWCETTLWRVLLYQDLIVANASLALALGGWNEVGGDVEVESFQKMSVFQQASF